MEFRTISPKTHSNRQNAQALPRLATASICETCRWSQSTARTRAISTMRYGPNRTPIRKIPAAGIYLLLRANVDHTELDEVYVPDDSDALSLPSLKVDASGMVVVRETEAESPAPSEPDSSEQSPADES